MKLIFKSVGIFTLFLGMAIMQEQLIDAVFRLFSCYFPLDTDVEVVLFQNNMVNLTKFPKNPEELENIETGLHDF